jgi:hypothetical protein
MRYEITYPTITFFLDNPKREMPSQAIISCARTPLTDMDLARICTALTRQCRGHALGSQRNYLNYFLKPFLAYCQSTGAELSRTSDEWQVFLLFFFQFFLSDTTWSTASATIRMKNWNTLVTSVFRFWREEKILPIDVNIPSIRMKNVQSEAKNQQLLGERKPIPTQIAAPPQKILVSIDFADREAEYLEKIEKACHLKIDIIKAICLAHWNARVQDCETGRIFSTSVCSSDITAAVESGQYAQRIRGGSLTPLASPRHPNGHVWALAITKHFLQTGMDRNCVSIHAHRSSPFFKNNSFCGASYYSVLANHTAMPIEAFTQLTSLDQYYRFAGILSSLDAAVACCLLTIEHPQFTSDALQSAKLLNSRDKSYLLLTDSDESSILSLDKPRAGSRKSVALTPLAQKFVSEIIAITAPVRALLKRAGDKNYRYLFLGYGGAGRLGILEPTTRFLNNLHNTNSLARLYPQLRDHNLGPGTLDYRRIRATMGVLKWFETGSIREMSRRLGNTTRVVLEHYLPAALLHAWNTRIIRRFQNTLIVLAAHDEDYLLDVTDFTSVADLQHFVAQLVIEFPGTSSPLAKEVQKRLGSVIFEGRNGGDMVVPEGLLNIRLSPTSLSYLYAFSDFAVNALTDEALTRVDPQSNLAPAQFVDLARLIRHACENELVASDLSELLDLSRLRKLHKDALVRQAALSGRFAKLSVVKQWECSDA